MRIRFAVLVLLAAAAAVGLSARSAPADGPNTTNLGKKIANVAFTDAGGKTTHLYDLKDKKAIVLVFLSFDCPVSTSYSQTLAELAADFGKQGVTFVGLTNNPDETPANVVKHAKHFNLPFLVVQDQKFAVGDALKAAMTPEVFVLDSDYVLRYRGRIDNWYKERLRQNYKVTSHDLKLALEAVVAGKQVTTAATEVIGCKISAQSIAAAKLSVTYYKDVLPILQRNCQECHRPGEVAPFSLMTYRQAVNWAADIKDFTHSRRMPPYKVVDGASFRNERRLTDKELAILASWADSGTPEGDSKDAPAPVKFVDGWRNGTPDLVLTLNEEYQLGPTGNDQMRWFVLPTGLTEDKYVDCVEVRTGNARISHHALLFADTSGTGRKTEKEQKAKPVADPFGGHPLDKGPGYFGGMFGGNILGGGFLGVWTPGNLPGVLPAGSGILLPKGSDVLMQMHYHRSGRLEKDKTSVGLYFAKKKVTHPYQLGVMMGPILGIPAGDARHVVKGTSTASADFTAYNVFPHMHMLGKEIKLTMTPPKGKPQVVMHITDWDFNWQETYFFKEPLKVKAGTKFDIEAVYDNSSKNPNNPSSPPRVVTFGEQTTNEMCFVVLGGGSERKGGMLPMSLFGLVDLGNFGDLGNLGNIPNIPGLPNFPKKK